MPYHIQIAMKIVGFLAAFVSCWFSVELYTSFAQTGLDKLIYTACGISLQLMQILAYICAWFYWFNGDKRKASVGFTCFIVLMGLSIVASIGFFSVVNKESSVSELHNSDVYAGMKSQLADVNSEIDSLQQQITIYSQKGYISKGVKPAQARIDELRAQKAELVEKIQNYKIAPTTDALYQYLAEFCIGKDYTLDDVQRIKLWIYLISAIALDVTSAVLLGFGMDFSGAGMPEPGRSRRTPDQPGGNGGNPPRGRKPRGDEDDEYVLRPGYTMHGSSTVPGTTHAELIRQNAELERELTGLKRGSNPVNPSVRYRESNPGSNPSVPYKESNGGYNPLDRGANPSVPYRESNPGYNPLDRGANPSVPYRESNPGSNPGSNPVNPSVRYRESNPGSIPEGIRECLPDYINMLYPVKPRIDQSLCGRRSIADAIGISQKQADRVHNWLKSVGLIYVQGTKTMTDYAKPEMLETLGLTVDSGHSKVINFEKREGV